ncbi:SDR family oxidoreductase [Patulibacter sp.]|uniref:SDR family NAD(P)-dependent oxidoreductase n=1 Tax=Patulibacter sp. TaxID=1912859 RepID=UPI0027207845|nr:SDR family NAD(P)-dependent oxidoreductase [Patulibacter sp.]MDO9410570.1 SDR family NAD(P)-dependent oxidoreductase [Patulibacter sp.]
MIGRRPGPTSGTAVVTGAGAGLGAAIAARLAARGLHVVAADIDLPGAERTAAATGGTARRLDVTDAQACRALVADTPDLVVWVNNAGILATGPGWSTDEATRRRLFDVNVHGLINGTTAALEVFRPARRGHVINVVSLAGLVPAPDETIYGATKHAALAFSVGTQLDLARRRERGVRISALCPDGIWTPMLFDHVDDPDAWPSWSGTMLQPDDVAAAAVELLDRPSPVRSIPRRRGLAARFYAATPGLSARGLRGIVWLAHRRQRAWARDNPRPTAPAAPTAVAVPSPVDDRSPGTTPTPTTPTEDLDA